MTGPPNFPHPSDRLKAAMAQAIDLFELTIDAPLKSAPRLKILDSPEFKARVLTDPGGHCVEIHTGVVATLDQHWDVLWDLAVLKSDNGTKRLGYEGQSFTSHQDLTNLSLIWLCLHELMHLQLDHLDYISAGSLIEVGTPEPTVHPPQNQIVASLSPEDVARLEKCLELQADCDATDIFLGLYSDRRWDDLRVLAVCIFAVIAIIERENTRLKSAGFTHPTAGTRFFTLFAHLFQMWQYPGAHLEQSDLGSVVKSDEPPDPDHLLAYAHAVLAPLVNDAMMVAAAAQAHTFLSDIGGAGAIFTDIQAVKYDEHLSETSLSTNAARQWLDLLPLNERLMKEAGHRE